MSEEIFSKEPHDWLLRAKMDLDSANILYNDMYPKPLEVICELCQHCAEKTVKGVYLALEDYEQSYPRKHDIRFLLEQIKNYVKFEDDLLDKGLFLTLFKTQQAYPTNIELDEYTTKKGLEYAEEIYAWGKEVVYDKKHIIVKKDKIP